LLSLVLLTSADIAWSTAVSVGVRVEKIRVKAAAIVLETALEAEALALLKSKGIKMIFSCSVV
jgi:hypothetical protein